MSITIELADGQRFVVDRAAATIGRGLEADITIDADELQPIHAKISKVAGRWMIESVSDLLLHGSDGIAGRKLWLHAHEAIRLGDRGPVIRCELTPLDDCETNLPADDSSPARGASCAESFDSQERESPRINFRGSGTVLVGRGTATFSGIRFRNCGHYNVGSIVVPLGDIAGVRVAHRSVCVSFHIHDAFLWLTFDAASAAEARRLTLALLPDPLLELQRKRNIARDDSRFIEPDLPHVFAVQYHADSTES
jgi:hypothetical protein